MYLETGLGDFKQRSPYKPRLMNVTARWSLDIPFRKDIKAFRQELIRAIGWPHGVRLLRDETDRKSLDGYLPEYVLKPMHNRLLKRKSPKLKEFDAVGVTVAISFWKVDYTDVWDIDVKD